MDGHQDRRTVGAWIDGAAIADDATARSEQRSHGRRAHRHNQPRPQGGELELLRQRLPQQLSRRADERLAGDIFLVSRLLADDDDRRVGVAGPEDRLRRSPPQGTASTAGGVIAELRERPLGAGGFGPCG